MKPLLSLFVFLLCLLPQLCLSQIDLKWYHSIPVESTGKVLDIPWAGGLSAAQFSDIDLDMDGKMDLVVFDRAGHAIVPFINKGTNGVVDYEYAPQYVSKFPKIRDWVLFVDYNGDGKKDIFTSVTAGMAVYLNESSHGIGLKFTLVTPLLFTQGYSYVNLYVSRVDIPAIVDMDNDGDVDVLTFGVNGTFIEYHKNYAMENHSNSDTLVFVVEDRCWGKVKEDFYTCKMELGISCKTGKKDSDTSRKANMHVGSTILALDMDGDGDKDVVIGDFSCNNLVMLTNGGDSSFANVVAIDTLFPSNTVPVNMYVFPAAFYVDVNNDGLRDLIVSPNEKVAENTSSVIYYINLGTDDSPVFSYRHDDFLQNGMIEVGEAANPVFFNYDGDSLVDLVVGNYGNFVSPGNFDGRLVLYKNVGTTTKPSFVLKNSDYADLSALNLNGLYPAFGDLDGDLDEDMMVGDYEGHLHYFENTAGVGDTANFVLTTPYYDSIDVGQFATPQLVDVDRDGRLDMLVGNRLGRVAYFKDTAVSSTPLFDKITSSFGKADAKEKPYTTGYSSPFLSVIDATNDYYFLMGSESGHIYLYEFQDSNIIGYFPLIDSVLSNVDVGGRASISGGDINSDGELDLIVGNERGGVTIYTGADTFYVPPPPFASFVDGSNSFEVYPNPANDVLHLRLLGNRVQIDEFQIYDLLGANIGTANIGSDNGPGDLITVDISTLPPGFYILRIIGGEDIFTQKVIKH